MRHWLASFTRATSAPKAGRRRIAPMAARMVSVLGCCLLLTATAPAAQAPATPSLQADLHARLEARMLAVADNLKGVLGYSIRDLATGESFEHNAGVVFPTAS